MFDHLHRSISSSSSSRRNRNLCIYGPSKLEDNFHLDEKKDEIQAVLHKIRSIYMRLEVGKDLLDRGFCFGLLDPVTNILVNGAISSLFPADPRAGGGGEGEGGGGGGGGRRERVWDMDQRSLDGLTAFLTCVFPYLPDAEAWGYLDAVDADPSVALLLIIYRRGMRGFDKDSHTTEAAVETGLRCAAVAANHPDPQWLVLGWKLLLPAVRQLTSLRSRKKHADVVLLAQKTIRDAIEANGMSDPGLQLKECWELAQRRLKYSNSNIYGRYRGELPPARAPMKRMLLATIHGFYLQALCRLPSVELRGQYHHSILMGGYCYGPLDPVSNIIVNTIWYSQNFPARKQFKLGMISTSGLWRVVARSLYGLVTFLCARYPGLTPDLAMQRLLVTRANLKDADPRLLCATTTRRLLVLKFGGCGQVGRGILVPDLLQCDAVERSFPSASIPEAYAAAAKAAFHPCPIAQKDFLGGSFSKLEDGGSGSRDDAIKAASEVLHAGGQGPLSSDDHELLCRILERCLSAGQSPQHDLAPIKTKKSLYAYKSRCCQRFWGQHNRVSSMVQDALDKYNDTTDGHPFALHIICGVNEFVSGPEPSNGEEVGEYNPWTRHKYYHSHINFLAICEERPYDPPTLFFAECGKDGASTCWCVPVTLQEPDAEQVRCVYCEYQGNRIAHPAVGSFHGCNEFDKLYYLSDMKAYTNRKLIEDKMADVDQVDALEDDAIYENCCIDEDDSDSEAHYWIDIC